MVGLGVQFAPPIDTLTADRRLDLNQASIAVGGLPGSQTVHRHVKNVSGSHRDVHCLGERARLRRLCHARRRSRWRPDEDKPFTVTFTRD